ncbi:MAG: substrate-binding domain-containing protein [Planctomycetes bacterium]|nr:substrate-binding domain-containing protein [Planctomycetota bacterium]
MRMYVALLLTALMISPAAYAGQKKDPKTMRIGYIMTDRNNVFQNMIAEAVKNTADKYGVQLVILDGENRAEKQVAQIENLVAQFYDGIILNPASYEGVTNGVVAAHREDVPLITVNQVVSNQDLCLSYIGSDAVESGRLQGEQIRTMTGGKGRVVVLHGTMGSEPEINRKTGLMQGLEGGDYVVVASTTANWQRDQAMRVVENWMQAGLDFDIIAAQNDNMAMGALKAVEDAGNADKIRVWGIDAIADACVAVKDGRLAGTVFQDAKCQGEAAMEAMVRYLQGEPLEKTIWIPYVAVDKDNVDKYM